MNKLTKNSIYNIAIALAIAMFFIIDQTLKQIALASSLKDISIFKDIFTFHFAPNYYIAFSIPLSGQLLNVLIIILIIALLSYLTYLITKNKVSRFEIICFAIMITGAISNIIDRLSYGYVIDYLSLRYFTVFNLADVMISSGALILILKNLGKTNK